ncbi:hypothetical protein [Motiliproteus coralliicola]|nr:hypothetical protein [Motiliproteus coralliicola]
MTGVFQFFFLFSRLPTCIQDIDMAKRARSRIKLLCVEIKMNEEASKIVIDLAKELISFVSSQESNWKTAYFRFHINGSNYGSNGSYEISESIKLFDPFEDESFFDTMNTQGKKLHNILSKKSEPFIVMLLTIDHSGNYKVLFENKDADKWKISKANGGTGVPNT